MVLSNSMKFISKNINNIIKKVYFYKYLIIISNVFINNMKFWLLLSLISLFIVKNLIDIYNF